MLKSRRPILTLLIAAVLLTGCAKVSRFWTNSGIEFTVQVETDKPDKDAVIKQAIMVIESKLSAIGIDGDAGRVPNTSDQIFVKIYGRQEDPERLKQFLFTTHNLELRRAVSAPNPAPLTTYATEAEARASSRPGQDVLPYMERDPERSPRQFVIVETASIVTGEDVRNAEAITRTGNDYDPDYTISFTLNKIGAEKFGDWTARNINNYIAVVLDGSIISAPYIKSQIIDMGQIDGRFTKAAAEELALSLSSGHLPARLTLLSELPFDN